MALYEYGVGGNEVKIDANEAIAENSLQSHATRSETHGRSSTSA